MANGQPPNLLTPPDMWDMEVTNEGYSPSAYPDSMGIPTIGVGHNLPAAGPEAIESLPGNPNYDSVLSGKQSLNPNQIQTLFDNDMSTAIDNALAIFPNFDTLPPPVQMSLSDMSFNLGPGKLSQFVDLQQAIADRDFQSAASAMQDSAWANQVGARAARDTLLVNLPDLSQFIQDQISQIIENSPDFENIDAWGAQPTFGPGDYPVPTNDQQEIANVAANTPVDLSYTPLSYTLDDPYAVVDDSGQPEGDDNSDSGGFSGGGPGDSSSPTGSYTGGSDSYGGEFGAEGGADDSSGWGGGQAGEGEAGGQFSGGEGGYDGEGGYGGYGESEDEGGGSDGGE